MPQLTDTSDRCECLAKKQTAFAPPYLVLPGDKQETAVNIARTCRLFQSNTTALCLNGTTPAKTAVSGQSFLFITRFVIL